MGGIVVASTKFMAKEVILSEQHRFLSSPYGFFTDSNGTRHKNGTPIDENGCIEGTGFRVPEHWIRSEEVGKNHYDAIASEICGENNVSFTLDSPMFLLRFVETIGEQYHIGICACENGWFLWDEDNQTHIGPVFDSYVDSCRYAAKHLYNMNMQKHEPEIGN